VNRSHTADDGDSLERHARRRVGMNLAAHGIVTF
jgi:hypothetical protein